VNYIGKNLWWIDLDWLRKFVYYDHISLTETNFKFFNRLLLTIKLTLLVEKLLNYKAIIFITPPFFNFFIAFLLNKIFGKRVISVVLDDSPQMILENSACSSFEHILRRYILYHVYSFLEYFTIRNSTAIFCCSKYLCKKYKKWNKNVFYSPNGSQIEYIEKIKKKKAVSEPYIYYYGGFQVWRGIDLLINAFSEVKKVYNYPLKLVLVGGTKKEIYYYPNLRPLLRKKDVVYLGHLPRSETIAFLKGAKIAVLPNRDTPMSHAISSVKSFDYIAAEIPQVCTNTGDHAEWVKKTNAGIVVEPTVDGIKKGILELLINRKKYKSIRRNCRKNKNKIECHYLKKSFIRYICRL
jgi:glycosyltransferase involved in cell wall biosynthesis